MSNELELEEWLPHVAGLPVGGRKRVPHHCGEGEPLLITRHHDKSTAYCFRCGGTGFYREHESLADKLARIAAEREHEKEARASVMLPQPIVRDTREWPLADKVWFFKMGFSLSMIGKLGMYWCPAIGRVVLPITEGDRVVYWLARSQKRTPKWITPDAPKQGLVMKRSIGKGDTIVLCEDALSAIKVGQCTESWSLLGTKLHPSVLVELVSSRKRVAVWLDNDTGRANGTNPGQEAAAAIMRRLSAFGVDCRNITSKRDPKYYDAESIRRKLESRPDPAPAVHEQG